MSSFVQQYIQAVPVCGMLISLPLLMHTEDDGSLWDRCSSSTYLRFGGCYQYVASQQRECLHTAAWIRKRVALHPGIQLQRFILQVSSDLLKARPETLVSELERHGA